MPNEVPVDYFAGLDQAGRRLDEAQRPELGQGSVEYVAPQEYMVRSRPSAKPLTYAERSRRGLAQQIRMSVPRFILCCPVSVLESSHTAQVRPPMPAVFFFVLDVTAGAVSSGMLAVACETIKGALDSLPGGERTHVGFLTFDSHLHYYNLSETPPYCPCLHALQHTVPRINHRQGPDLSRYQQLLR